MTNSTSNPITLDLADWQAADLLFDTVLQLPDQDRAAAIQQSDCSESVRAAALALLATYQQPSALDRSLLRSFIPLPHNVLANTVIGRWRLEQEIGRGGMAVVYRARNTEQAQHVVALKLMQPHRDNNRIRERFAQEVLLQAKLNHPQLAQFFDAGSYLYGEQTLLWLAMRWVEGVAIDRWCERGKLTVIDRIKLFLSVCDAISYAHSQLVVHCDLKPSNILIEQSSQRAVVLDFGIAAWMDGDLDAASGSFRYLSPAYAAPEQFSSAAPSTAMDIHGLGSTLYQLLVDSPPKRESPKAAATRPSELRTANAALLRGDLDAIVLKALATDPADRYRTVEALRADLERFLSHQPVIAYAAPLRHQLKLWSKRRRDILLAASAIFSALLLGLLTALFYAYRAQQASTQAQIALLNSKVAEQKAIAQAQRAEALQHFAVGVFESTIPTKPAGEIPSAQALLRSAEMRARNDQTMDANVRIQMLLTLASIYMRRNLTSEATTLSQEAHRLASELADPELHASALRLLARLDLNRSDFAAADSKLQHALALLSSAPQRTEVWFQVRFEQASSAMFKRDFSTASTILYEAIALARKANINPETLLGLLQTQAICLKQSGMYQAALPFSLETAQLRERMLGPNDRAVALSIANHGNLLAELAQFDAASAALNRAQQIYAAINDPSYEPAIALYRSKGDLAWLVGDLNSAEQAWEQANSGYAALRGVNLAAYPFHYSDQARLALARFEFKRASVLMEALFTRASDYLKQRGDSLNLNALHALGAGAHCLAGRRELAKPHVAQLQQLELSSSAAHLRAEYQMALLECAFLDGNQVLSKSLAAAIRADDSQLAAGRAREIKLRRERLKAMQL